MQRIGVFGASFNPPTVGHRDVIIQALPHFEQILLVPSLQHAFAKVSAPIAQRLDMLKLFLEFWPNDARICIENIEEEIQKELPPGAPIYTFDVLSRLEEKFKQQQHPFKLYFMLGPDLADPNVWQKFYRYQDIEKNWSLFHVAERIKVHSTQLRALIAENQSSPDLKEKLMPLVGEKIAEYIIEHQLYGANPHE